MERHRIVMLETTKGKDGATARVREYLAGEVVDVGADLRRAFLGMGAAQDYPPAGLEGEADDSDDLLSIERDQPGEDREAKIVGPEEPRRRGRPPGRK